MGGCECFLGMMRGKWGNYLVGDGIDFNVLETSSKQKCFLKEASDDCFQLPKKNRNYIFGKMKWEVVLWNLIQKTSKKG